MIDLPKIKLFNRTEIQELIKTETDEYLELYLPRTSKQFFSEREDIAYDYAFAAYSGQLISEDAEYFEYTFSLPSEFVSYTFKIKNFDPEALAETLYDISCLYGYTGNDEDEENVTIEEVNQFLDDVEAGKITAACPELIAVFEEFTEEEED